jgi:heavy metal sensor kinase
MTLPIRVRLALLSGALMAGLIVGLGTFLYLRLEANMIDAVDDGLEARASALGAGWAGGPLPGRPADAEDAFAQLVGRDGSVLAVSPGLREGESLAPADVATLAAGRFYQATVETVEETIPARLLALPTDDGAQVLVVGESIDDQRAALDDLRWLLGALGSVAVTLAFGVGWLLAGAALRPVERMRLGAEQVSGAELDRRLPVPRTRDELQALGGSLNRMLERIEQAVRHERRFVDDASHELRTPLANLKAELDLALRRSRTSDELVAALRSASEETDRLTRLAEDLLVLARLSGGELPIRRTRVDLNGLVEDTLRGFRAQAAARDVSVGSTVDVAGPLELDERRMRQVLANLVDNAIRETPGGGQVAVDVSVRDGWLEISVTDTGAGFPEAFLAHAFDAFSRSDSGRARAEGGTGLGLAIVRAIVEAHGGSVEARNRPQGGGLVSIRLPTAIDAGGR